MYASDFVLDVVPAFNRETVIPELDAMYIIDQPTYIHSAFRIASFGHILRDNLLTIVANLDSLELRQYTYQVVLFSHVLPTGSGNTRTFHKYVKTVAPISMDWGSLVLQAKTAQKTYILLKDVVVGTLMLKYHPLRVSQYKVSPPPPEQPVDAQSTSAPRRTMSTHFYFKLMRDIAYEHLGVGLVRDTRDHQPIRVLFGDKSEADKRRITNIPELLPTLRNRFKDLRIDSVEMHQFSPQEQLSVLSRTSVFISPVRCPSFPQTQ